MPPDQSPLMKALNPLAAPLYSRLRYPRVPDFPRSFMIETTSRCNLNCRMCPRGQMRRPAQDMAPELFRSIIDQIAEYDRCDTIELVALHGFGEPLMHPELCDFIEYAGSRLPNLLKRGMLREAVKGLAISTNAVLMDEDRARPLLDSKLTWLGVSLDGSTAETFEAMRVGARFDEVAANISRLLEINRRTPRALPTIAIQVIASRTTEPEFSAVVRRWREVAGPVENVRIELKPYTDWAGQVQAEELHSADQRRHFLQVNCGYAHHTMVIAANGQLGLCCRDVQADQGLGSAMDTPLRELWHGLRLNEIRRKLASGWMGDLRLCCNCEMSRKYPADCSRR